MPLPPQVKPASPQSTGQSTQPLPQLEPMRPQSCPPGNSHWSGQIPSNRLASTGPGGVIPPNPPIPTPPVPMPPVPNPPVPPVVPPIPPVVVPPAPPPPAPPREASRAALPPPASIPSLDDLPEQPTSAADIADSPKTKERLRASRGSTRGGERCRQSTRGSMRCGCSWLSQGDKALPTRYVTSDRLATADTPDSLNALP